MIVLAAAAWPAERGGAQAPPSAQMPPTGTGLIAGQVIDAQSGKPIPDVSVALIARVTTPATLPGGRGAAPFATSVISDSQGRFFFANLPAGTFMVLASKRGYTQPPGASGAGATFELTNGERITTGVVRIVKSATLSGTLRDETGDPVVGTGVIVGRRTIVNGRPELVVMEVSTSDDRGMYRFTNLPPGDYLLCACRRDPNPFDQTLLGTLASQPLHLLSLAGRAITVGSDAVTLDESLRVYAPTFYPNSATVARATVILLTSGEDRVNTDITTPLVRASRVTGRIVGAQSPLSSFAVTLIPADETTIGGLTAFQPMLLQPDGRFDFASVPPGQYRLVVSHRETSARGGGPSGLAMQFVGARGFPPLPGAQMAGRGASPLLDEPPLWADELITVGERSTVTVNVTLQRGVRVSGRVELIGAPLFGAEPAGAVTPPPVRFAVSMANLGVVPTLQESIVGPDGRSFSVFAGAPGKYGFRANVGGGMTLRSITMGGVDVTDLPVDIGTRDVSDVVVTFTNEPRASLQVTTPAPLPGQPPPDDALLVFPADRRYWAFPTPAISRFVTVPLSSKGTATATNLPAATYFVVLVPPIDSVNWQEQSKMDALSRRAQTVTLLEGEKKSLEVKR